MSESMLATRILHTNLAPTRVRKHEPMNVNSQREQCWAYTYELQLMNVKHSTGILRRGVFNSLLINTGTLERVSTRGTFGCKGDHYGCAGRRFDCVDEPCSCGGTPFNCKDESCGCAGGWDCNCGESSCLLRPFAAKGSNAELENV